MNKRIVISRCLLGECVRYDGSHKLNQAIIDKFAQGVEWIPVCPEVDCGMSIPRAPMQLVQKGDEIKLVVCETGEDKTSMLKSWCEKKVDELKQQKIDGFILKSRSPSCAIRELAIVDSSGHQVMTGMGLFAQVVRPVFPTCFFMDEDSAL